MGRRSNLPSTRLLLVFEQLLQLFDGHVGQLCVFLGGDQFADALLLGILLGLEDSFESLTPAEIVERFCYAGETKHIRARYLAGKELT